MKVVRFAAVSTRKLETLRRLLEPHGFGVLPADLELLELQVTDLRAVTEAKLLDAFWKIDDGSPVIVQETGFCLPSWGGFPGPFVTLALASMGIEGILTLGAVRGRDCEFRECLGYFEPGGKPQLFEEIIPGRLSTKPRGMMGDAVGSVLELIFIPEGREKTLAEMAPEERAAWRKEHEDFTMVRLANWLASASVPA